MEDNDPLNQKVIGFAIEVHRNLGLGRLESAYEKLDHGWARIDTDEILICKESPSLGGWMPGTGYRSLIAFVPMITPPRIQIPYGET